MNIELRDLTKVYGKTPALDRVTLGIEPGQIIAVLGVNGAGKTTLLRCLAGIVGVDRGQILYDEQPFLRGEMALRRRLFFLPDFPLVFENWSVIRHLGMVARLYEKADSPDLPDKIIGLLREFDLLPLARLPFANLSRGQHYKAALAALLAVDPELWLLDEPFASGIDPVGIQAFRTHARQAAQRGSTLIYSTQILEVAEKFSDRVCVIHHGAVRAFESVIHLREQFQNSAGPLYGLFQQLHEEDRA